MALYSLIKYETTIYNFQNGQEERLLKGINSGPLHEEWWTTQTLQPFLLELQF